MFEINHGTRKNRQDFRNRDGSPFVYTVIAIAIVRTAFTLPPCKSSSFSSSRQPKTLHISGYAHGTKNESEFIVINFTVQTFEKRPHLHVLRSASHEKHTVHYHTKTYSITTASEKFCPSSESKVCEFTPKDSKFQCDDERSMMVEAS